MLRSLIVAAALSVSALPAQAATYAIDFDGQQIDITGTITTDGSTGVFANLNAFGAIVTASSLTATGATQGTTVFEVAAAPCCSQTYTVSETEIVITPATSGGGFSRATNMFPNVLATGGDTGNDLSFSVDDGLQFGDASAFDQEAGLASLTLTAGSTGVVPLPATLPMLAGALGLVVALRRR